MPCIAHGMISWFLSGVRMPKEFRMVKLRIAGCRLCHLVFLLMQDYNKKALVQSLSRITFDRHARHD
jgi:hypothetical protein